MNDSTKNAGFQINDEQQKGMRFLFSCTAEMKKCCEKYKKGKRCKKCPKR